MRNVSKSEFFGLLKQIQENSGKDLHRSDMLRGEAYAAYQELFAEVTMLRMQVESVNSGGVAPSHAIAMMTDVIAYFR